MFKRIAIGATLGGLAGYVSGRIQEDSGGRARSQKPSALRRIGGALRGGGGKVAGVGQTVGGQAAGLAHKAGHGVSGVAHKAAEGVSGVAHKAGEGASAVAGKVTGGGASERDGDADSGQDATVDDRALDDVTLARKVETEIFRDADAPKGSVNVNAQEGVVQLRGEVERQELIDDLVGRTRDVQGVEDVENLLHLPGEPAPMHQ